MFSIEEKKRESEGSSTSADEREKSPMKAFSEDLAPPPTKKLDMPVESVEVETKEVRATRSQRLPSSSTTVEIKKAKEIEGSTSYFIFNFNINANYL